MGYLQQGYFDLWQLSLTAELTFVTVLFANKKALKIKNFQLEHKSRLKHKITVESLLTISNVGLRRII